MNIYSVAYKNLLRKKVRTALTASGIALSAWVLATLFGFNRGYESGLNRDVDNMGFQVLLTAKGCPYEAATLMLKGGTGLRYMEEDVVKTVSSNKEVEAVTRMLMQGVFDPNKGDSGAIAAYLGVDTHTFPAMKPYLEFKQGGWFKTNDGYEAVMGYEAAELEAREVGDPLLIPDLGTELKVVGVLTRTGTQDDGTIFLPLDTVQKIFKKEGKLTGLGIKVDKNADMGAFENRLYDLPDVQVVSMAQVKTTIMSLVSSARVIVFAIAFIAVLIAMAGVVNTILMSVIERYGEIGILKSMGAMPLDIFRMIWMETAILCSLGGFGGILLSLATARAAEAAVRHFLPYTPNGDMIAVNFSIAAGAFGVIFVGGLLSGVYPAWRAARVRPLEAIRNEGE